MKYSVIFFLLFYILILSISGCAKESRLQYALREAGGNRQELEKVLEHYKNDSLKLLAAQYLIENMPYHYGWIHEDTVRLHAYYHALQGSNVPADKICDSIRIADGVYDTNRKHLVRDIESVNSTFLIDHIDKMFEIWEMSTWSKDLSFDTFRNHILPFRLRDEPLRPWVEELNKKFDPLLDSLRNTRDSADIKKAATIILDHFCQNQIYFTHAIPQNVNVGVDNVYWKTGDCKEFADILTWVLRSVGIPCGCDMMIVRGDNNVPHYWNYIIDNDGKSWYGSITYDSTFKSPDTYWNPKGKVWRECFALNQDLQTQLLANSEIVDIFPTFRYPLMNDVTYLYANPELLSINIDKSILDRIPSPNENVYICLSLKDKWIPIGVAEYNDNMLEVSDIEGEVVLRLATYSKDGLEFISAPFLVDRKTGELKWYFVNDKKETEVCLFHKFNLRTEPFGQRMIGGTFEGSNRIDFLDADTLFQIQRYPDRLYNKILMEFAKKYRYLRYKSPKDGYCDISEIWFYDVNGEKVIGQPIGISNKGRYDSGFVIENVFDGDPYTSFHYEQPDDGWVGLALDTPTLIKSIVFTPRNRKNFIQPGNEYELFYCDDDWRSAGRIIADSDSLIYKVPMGTLLFLKNHTEGNQERIFEMTEEGQHWL